MHLSSPDSSNAIVWENIIDEYFETPVLPPDVFDAFMAVGWRLLGAEMIRHNISTWHGALCSTVPLRVRLENFELSKSQQRLMRRNADLDVRIGAIAITPQKEALFLTHTQRFRERRPEGLHNFILPQSAEVPVPGLEIEVWEGNNLIACSYVHAGLIALSATYCFFDPAYSKRSPGIYTMLLELELARQMGYQFYYHGYCYSVPSQFDYKRNFSGLEMLDWSDMTWRTCS
jgi:leucyl-tRNA---protein transferase